MLGLLLVAAFSFSAGVVAGYALCYAADRAKAQDE
jgi:hypothetical protein